jgi:triacylglycerol lipase
VLVHGTFEGATDSWLTVSPQIKAAGYCVFALEYGNRGTGDITASAGELQRFVDRHDAALVHQVPRRRGEGRRPRRARAVQPRHDEPGALVAGATFCPACDQQRAGSAFLQQLNAGDETPGSVSYTVVETRYEEVVTPFTSAFLAPGPNTADILLQDACPADVVDHQFIPDDRIALRWTLQALGRSGPADPAHPPSCA